MKINEDIEIGNKKIKLRELIEYSTTEKKIGKWVNGKDIYRKVIHYTGALTGGRNAIPHNTAYDTMLSAKAIVPYENSFYFSGAYINANQFIAISSASPTEIVCYIGSSWENSFKKGCFLIIEYTK